MTAPLAWVTGGGTGIGRALAEALAADGYRVVISGRRADRLEETAQAFRARSLSGEIHPLAGDVANPISVQAMSSSITSQWGAPDLLINNAGQNPSHSFREASVEEFQQIFEVNCLSAIRCTKAVLPAMLQRGSGAIVNISSILGRWASSDSAAYSMSKFALSGFTDALRQELSGTPIHVMAVYPGFIRTAMTEPFVKPGSLKAWIGYSPESMAKAILKGLRNRRREVQFPWYVPLALAWYRWMPGMADGVAQRLRRMSKK